MRDPGAHSLYRFRALQLRLRRLRVPGSISDRLAPVVIGRGVRLRRDTATFPAGEFRASAPRRFLENYVASTYEPQLTRWISEHLPLQGTTIDVGAHVGYLTMVMANRVGPTGHVYAIEPALENVNYLVTNLQENNIDNVDILPVAIASRPGLARFNLNASSDSFGFFEHPNTATVDSRWVPVMSLDAIFSESRLPRLDLVKLDVEGAEVEALDGMAETLDTFPGAALAVEWFPAVYEGRGVDPLSLPRRLVELGYNVMILDTPDGGPSVMDEVRAALGRHALPKSWYCNLVTAGRSAP